MLLNQYIYSLHVSPVTARDQGSWFHRNLGKYRAFFLLCLAAVRGNEIADELARDGYVLKFVGPEPAFGVSTQDMRRRIRPGWTTSIGYGGEVLVTPKDRLQS
jgi:hypothetical protein